MPDSSIQTPSSTQTEPTNGATTALAGNLRVVIGQLVRRLRETVTLGDLTWSQIQVLGRLDRNGPATVSTLARAEGVRPQSMGATVAALEASGYVIGTPDPNDGRQTILTVTEACHAWFRIGRAAREDWLHQALQTHLTAAEQADLARAVELLRRLVDPASK